jgi:hypothetical protein
VGPVTRESILSGTFTRMRRSMTITGTMGRYPSPGWGWVMDFSMKYESYQASVRAIPTPRITLAGVTPGRSAGGSQVAAVAGGRSPEAPSRAAWSGLEVASDTFLSPLSMMDRLLL